MKKTWQIKVPARLSILTLFVTLIVAASVGKRQRSETIQARREPPITGDSPLNRLNRALNYLGRPPDNVFREIRRFVRSDQPLCDFQWNNGQPVFLGRNQSADVSGAAFARCATVVEALPTGRMRLLFRIKDQSGGWTINPRWPHAVRTVIDHKLAVIHPGTANGR